jgi:phosphotransferase system IIB component
MAKKDYKAMAAGIIKQAGGADNIVSATHCMTRLRLVLRDRSKFDTDAVKQVPGVLNVIIQNGEYQVVIGQDVPDLYEEVVKIDGIQAGGSVQDDEAAAKDLAQDHGNIGNAILSFIGGTFSPVIPVLVAGGLTGAVLSLLTNVFGVSAESGTYTIFYAINQATFYFLPIFIGFAAAARLKSNGFLGAFLGAILLYSSINGAEGLDFFGIPVQAISYNSTVFPVILGVLFMSVVYKFLQKHIPVFLKTIVVPLLTMLITVPVTLIVLGPIGNTVGTWLANGVYALYQAVPALAVMVIGINALSGPLHGGANEAVLRQLKAIRDSGKTVKEFVEDAKANGHRISGLGHRVYKSYDPRAAIAKTYLQKIMERADTLKLPADERALFDVATELEQIALSDDYFVSRHLYPNVDFYTGLIYRAIGFDPSMFTTLFALGRIPGWIAQYREMLADPNTKIGRPRQVYTGYTERDYVPMDQRH